jgi:NAD(P)-dependent dehydrogenase (short-subunit alcohol dehydrogenase family)
LSEPGNLARVLNKIPWKRIGEAEDIVGAAVFLSSSESDYVTGSTLYADGGMLLS